MSDFQEAKVMTITQLVIAISIPILTVVLNAMVSYTIRFSKDAATARQSLVKFLLRCLAVPGYGYLAVAFYLEATSPEPLTRASVVNLILWGSGLLLGCVLLLVQMPMRFQLRHLELFQEALKVIDKELKNRGCA